MQNRLFPDQLMRTIDKLSITSRAERHLNISEGLDLCLVTYEVRWYIILKADDTLYCLGCFETKNEAIEEFEHIAFRLEIGENEFLEFPFFVPGYRQIKVGRKKK